MPLSEQPLKNTVRVSPTSLRFVVKQGRVHNYDLITNYWEIFVILHYCNNFIDDCRLLFHCLRSRMLDMIDN